LQLVVASAAGSMAQINSGAVIERIFHHRVRQVVPDLQKKNAKHPVDSNRRAATFALELMRFNQPA
jgi:hypothetical protein